MEAGFHNLKEVRQQRIRCLKDIIAEDLVGYRLWYRSASFADYALGHVSRLLGAELVVDIDEAAVLGYQEDRLREEAAPKSINEEVRFLLKMLGDPGEVIRAHLRKKKQLKLAVRLKNFRRVEMGEGLSLEAAPANDWQRQPEANSACIDRNLLAVAPATVVAEARLR